MSHALPPGRFLHLQRCFLLELTTAGFTLSGALFRKKMWGPFTYFFVEKIGRPFLLIAVVHSGESPIISLFRACKKFPAPFVGAPFCEAPVRLNMRKSAAVTHSVSARPRLGLVNTALGSAWRVNKTYNKVSKLQSTSV